MPFGLLVSLMTLDFCQPVSHEKICRLVQKGAVMSLDFCHCHPLDTMRQYTIWFIGKV